MVVFGGYQNQPSTKDVANRLKSRMLKNAPAIDCYSLCGRHAFHVKKKDIFANENNKQRFTDLLYETLRMIGITVFTKLMKR